MVPLRRPGQPSALQTLPEAGAHSINNYVPMARARFILGFIPGSHKLPMKRACKSLRGSKACWLLAGQDQLARFLSTSWRSKHDVLQGRVIHAVPLIRSLGAIIRIEDVAQVPTALCAVDLYAAVIFQHHSDRFFAALVKR